MGAKQFALSFFIVIIYGKYSVVFIALISAKQFALSFFIVIIYTCTW